jgi:hypothetical protein
MKWKPRVVRGPELLELVHRYFQAPGGIDDSAVVTGETYSLPLFSNKFHRCAARRIGAGNHDDQDLDGRQ